MLFKVDMTVKIPLGYPADELEDIKQREKLIRSNYSVKAPGDISGASPDCTPMSVF